MSRLVASAAAVAAALIGRVEIASAGCGGGGGGGGGGGHSVSCKDDSDVVGFRHCKPYGAWSSNLELPPLIFESGASVRRFASLLGGQDGSVTHGNETFAYRVVAQPALRRPIETAVQSTMRVSGLMSHGLYAAVEVDLGGVVQSPAATTEMMTTGAFGTPQLTQQHGFIADSLGAVGIRADSRVGSFGVELAGGVRVISYGFASSYHDCSSTTDVVAAAAVAEVRARGELWLGPWVTAGATAGTSVIERGAWMAGFYIGVHGRSFDATR